MTNEENVTITQTAPDGTETVIEITQTRPDNASGDDQSVVEEVIEALFDTDDDQDGDNILVTDTDTNADPDDAIDPNGQTDDPDLGYALGSQDTGEAITDDETGIAGAPPQAEDPAIAASPEAGGISDTTTDQADPTSPAEDGTAGNQAHIDAATDAQRQADEFMAQGDYAAASEAREVAENEAYAGGDDSMLSGSNASELSNAADYQAMANRYEQQEAADAHAGNWDAAKEDASNAAYAQGSADYYGGGSDHTGQAKAEESQMDWAGWEQDNADSAKHDAEEYAAEGDFDSAERSAELADSHQDAADYHGALGEHGGDMAVYDPSSEVASGGSYEASDDSAAADYSSSDASTTDYSTE